MDARQLRRALDTIRTAAGELKDLRWHRVGRHSAAELREELEAINKGIAAGNGLLLRQKLEWFNHDSLLKELGNLKVIMQQLTNILADADVRQEIIQEGFSFGATAHNVEHTLQWIQEARAAVDRHEQVVQKALQGIPAKTGEMLALEYPFLELTELEERVEALSQQVLDRASRYDLERQPRPFLNRVAAAIVLPFAAAAAMLWGMTGQAYAQDVTKQQGKPPQEQSISIEDQIAALERKADKTPEDYLKLTDLYTRANKLDKASETISGYLKNNPNDIRGLLQRKKLNNKKGIKYNAPDENLQKLIDGFDKEKYENMISKESKYKEAISDLEPILERMLSYELSELNDSQKAKVAALMNVLAAAYDMTNQKDHALASCFYCLEIVPNWSAVYTIIGSIYRQRKEYASAMSAFKKYTELEPNKHYGYAGIGRCYRDQGDFEKAIPYFEEALKRAPTPLVKKYQKEIDNCKEKLGKK